MGLETALLVIGGGSLIGEGVSQISASESQTRALALQHEQELIQYQQKTISNYDSLQKVLQAEEAEATVRGVSLSSPSLGAVARNQMNISAKTQGNLDTQKSIQDENYENEKDNVQDTLFAKLFGDVSSAAEGFFKVTTNAPSLG